MDTNYWFYTLSTIAQSLAAIIALFATFVVVVLSTINKEINDYTERIISILVKFNKKSQMDYYAISKESIHNEFLSLFEKNSISYEDSGLDDVIERYVGGLPLDSKKRTDYKKNFINNINKIFNKFKTKKISTYQSLRMSLVLTSINIIASFVGLVFLPPYLYYGIFLVFCSSMTIVYVTVSIWKIIND